MSKKLKDYSLVSLESEDLASPVSFSELFGRIGPVHIEIGSGKGTFLVNQARVSPETNFLGIEWANKYYRYAVDRIGRRGLDNVRIIRTDASVFLGEHVPDRSVNFFHIYFPDPWPKKRHHKRRFFCDVNLGQLLRCLVASGKIQFVTDHEDYFQQAHEALASVNGQLEQVEFEAAAGAGDDELVGTNYERKYIRDQRQIFQLAYRKTS